MKTRREMKPSAESIASARAWYIENMEGCIEDALSGKTRVNDLAKYVADQTEAIARLSRGESDYTFALLQRAWFIETGECVALLP